MAKMKGILGVILRHIGRDHHSYNATQEVVKVKKYLLTIFAVVGLIATIASMSTTAYGDAVYNQCNTHWGQTFSNTGAWFEALNFNRVVQATEEKVFKPAGYNPLDQTLPQWLKDRVMVGNVVRAFAVEDNGCLGRTGDLFSAGYRHYGVGKGVFYVVPNRFSKAMIRNKRTKLFSKRLVIKVTIIGFTSCGNPVLGTGYVAIYIRVPHRVVKRHKPKKRPPVKKTGCTAGNGGCGTQTSTATTTCGNGQILSATGCVTISTNNNCGTVVVGSGSVTNGGNNCNTTIITSSPPPPAPEITLTSFVNVNQVPAGSNSGCTSSTGPSCVEITCYASEAGGSLTVDPGIGSISACNSSTQASSLTVVSLPSGNFNVCLVLYAPNDVDQPSSMTVTATADLGTAQSTLSQTFQISYPTRSTS